MRFDSSLRSDAVVRRSSRLIPTFINMESVVSMVSISACGADGLGSNPSARATIGCVKLVSLMMLVSNHDIVDE